MIKKDNSHFLFTGQSFVKRVFSLLCVLTMFLTTPMNAFAYSSEVSEITDDGSWVVNNDVALTSDVIVVLYMLVQPDEQAMKARWHYTFSCTDGTFDYGDDYVSNIGTLVYEFTPLNKKVLEVLPEGEVWIWQFAVEEGKYIFAEPGGIDKISVLPTSLGSPFYEDGYTEGDVSYVEKGDSVYLFALYGDYDWRRENYPAMKEWAEKRNEIMNRGDTSSTNGKTDVIKVEQDNAPLEEEVSETKPFEEIETEDGNVASDENNAFQEQTENTESEKESPLLRLLKYSPIFIILVIICIVIKKKESEPETLGESYPNDSDKDKEEE